MSVSGDTFWRPLFNALSPDEARQRTTIGGNSSLAAPLLTAPPVIV